MITSEMTYSNRNYRENYFKECIDTILGSQHPKTIFKNIEKLERELTPMETLGSILKKGKKGINKTSYRNLISCFVLGLLASGTARKLLPKNLFKISAIALTVLANFPILMNIFSFEKPLVTLRNVSPISFAACYVLPIESKTYSKFYFVCLFLPLFLGSAFRVTFRAVVMGDKQQNVVDLGEYRIIDQKRIMNMKEALKDREVNQKNSLNPN